MNAQTNQIVYALLQDKGVKVSVALLTERVDAALNELDGNYLFRGVVQPWNSPGAINTPTLVAACVGGTYSGYSSIVLDQFTIAFFYTTNGVWKKLVVYSYLKELEVRIKTLEGQDLSLVDAFGNTLTAASTANCYVIRKAGKYRIPLVYGNGIKNGAPNPAAYTRQGDAYTADFVNHLGNVLTSPYIQENEGCAAADAGLLWQTTKGMVSSVVLDGDFIAVEVTAVPDTNGLAVVWVKDANGDIMWSWTLWVTADDLTPVVFTNHTEVDYNLMPVGLGAIWDSDRSHYVTPHYQWGRKDPFIPGSAYNSTTPMTTYDILGNVYGGAGVYGVADDQDAGGTVRSVANAIKMPEKFFLQYDAVNYNWNNLEWFNNFWNAAITTQGDLADNQDSAIKTIYDPCPTGWIMPASRFATGFTTTGGNVGSGVPEGCEVVGEWANGWTFKRNAEDTEGHFIPAAGNRNRASGSLANMGSSGKWWAFAPNSKMDARYLYFSSASVSPLGTDNRAAGFAVLPSRE